MAMLVITRWYIKDTDLRKFTKIIKSASAWHWDNAVTPLDCQASIPQGISAGMVEFS